MTAFKRWLGVLLALSGMAAMVLVMRTRQGASVQGLLHQG